MPSVPDVDRRNAGRSDVDRRSCRTADESV